MHRINSGLLSLLQSLGVSYCVVVAVDFVSNVNAVSIFTWYDMVKERGRWMCAKYLHAIHVAILVI